MSKEGDQYEVKGRPGAVQPRNAGKSASFRLSESGKAIADEKVVVSLLIFSGAEASKMLAPATSSKSAARSSVEGKLKTVLQTNLIDGAFRFVVRLADTDVIVLKIGIPSAVTPVMDPPAAVLAVPSRQLLFEGMTAKSTALGGMVTAWMSAIAATAEKDEASSVAVSLAIGDGFTCYLSGDGRIHCNGFNSRYLEATAHNTQSSVYRLASTAPELRVPTEVECPNCSYATGASTAPIRETFMQITAGQNHACALAQSKNVYCWGLNQRGQSGVGYLGAGSIASPTRIDTAAKFITIGAGVDHTCGITDTNKVMCWGDNRIGKFVPDFTCSGSEVECNAAFSPMEITGSSSSAIAGNIKLAQVVAGQSTTCVRTSVTPKGEGPVFCWGENSSGQAGCQEFSTPVPRIDRPTAPVLRPQLEGQPSVSVAFRSISAGRAHFCGLTYDDKMMCWGENRSSQIMNASMSIAPIALEVHLPDGRAGRAISASGLSTCIVTTTGSLYCRGASSSLLGCGDAALGAMTSACTVASPSEVAAANAPVYTAVEGSRFGASDASVRCGRTTTGSYYCWGSPYTSALGIGGSNSLVPAGQELVPNLVAPFSSRP